MTIQQANNFFAALPETAAQAAPLQTAMAALGCGQTAVRFVAVTGSAGKTGIASSAAAILQAAGFDTGRYQLGLQPLRQRIFINGKLADGRAYAAAAARLANCSGLTKAAAELACAAALFERAGCAFAAVELCEPGLAAALPRLAACAVARIGPDGTGRSIARMAYAAAGTFRKGMPAVTVPDQPKEALQEIIVAAGKADCPLTVPDRDDFTLQKHRRLENRVDYGGYGALLPTAGFHAACNAAAAVELALALWRGGVPIEDEAILAGLAAADPASGVRVLRRRPLTVLDPCHTPVQAAALAAALQEAGYERLSLIVGLLAGDDAEGFFAALENGFVPEADKTDENQLAGMSDNAFERVYLVTPEKDAGMPAHQAAKAAKYHFDATVCESLAEAVRLARADENEGVVLCGGEGFVAQAKRLLK